MAWGIPESESNLEVDAPRNIGIDIRPGFRVKPRERPDHESSSSRFVPDYESNLESDQAAPIRYDIELARRELWSQAGALEPGGSFGARRGAEAPGDSRSTRRQPQHQAD